MQFPCLGADAIPHAALQRDGKIGQRSVGGVASPLFDLPERFQLLVLGKSSVRLPLACLLEAALA